VTSGTKQAIQLTGYRIEQLLGAGAMGRVFRAVQVDLERVVALKVLAARCVGSDDARRRFVREAQVAARVNHPNVVTVYDAGIVDDMPFMAMELVAGGDVAAAMARAGGRLDEVRALSIARDMAAGLEAIEAAGLIHRDIKPANVFLDGEGRAKLADLGLARQVGEHSSSGLPLGTPAFMAPEQARGEDLDIRSDIYAVGASLFAMVTGRPPVLTGSALEALQQAGRGEIADIPRAAAHVSEDLRIILRRALSFDRDERYVAAKALRLSCETALDAIRSRSQVRDENQAANGVSLTPLANRVVELRREDDYSGSNPVLDEQLEAVDPQRLSRLARHIHVDEDGMQAWLYLAPGAAMPVALTRAVLKAAGVSVGLRDGAIVDASRRCRQARRLVLAQGTPPSPGVGGGDVYAAAIPPLDTSVEVRMSGDAMEAYVLFRPGYRVSSADLDRALAASGVVYGRDHTAMRAVQTGDPALAGRVVVARGRKPIPSRAAGFRLCETASAGADALLALANLSQVIDGECLARWQDMAPGAPGFDVQGYRLVPPVEPARRPGDFAGEGVELTRDEDGVLILRAATAGVVQQRVDGVVRVVPAYEVRGNLSASAAAIETDDLVVVHGDVEAGARISCGSDVVVLGDVHNACIESGGCVQVRGSMTQGDEAVVAGNGLVVDGDLARTVVAGSIVVGGNAVHSDLVATGEVRVRRAVGGRIVAGGSVLLDIAGDADGTATELWAGYNVAYDEMLRMATLAERGIRAESERLASLCSRIERERSRADRRSVRLDGVNWVSDAALARHRQRLAALEQARGDAEHAVEGVRARLAAQRELVGTLQAQAENQSAEVHVAHVAHRGVVAGVAGSDAMRLRRDKRDFRLQAQ
jgi:serine/threonine protein kinase/uncharacterized protein (DUF342 family)